MRVYRAAFPNLMSYSSIQSPLKYTWVYLSWRQFTVNYLKGCLSHVVGRSEGQMRPSLLSFALLTAATVFAQDINLDSERVLFPPASDILHAAKLGYQSERQWRMDLAYQLTDRDRAYYACASWPREIRVAGPLLLAAMEGETARLHSLQMPTDDEILHANGTLLFQLVFFSRRDDERATVVLKLGTHEFQPLTSLLDSAEMTPCETGWSGGQIYTIRVKETFTFGFAPGQIQSDLLRNVKLEVRRPGRKHICEMDLQRALVDQAKRIHRQFQ